MESPAVKKHHKKQYFLYGSIAGIAYCVFTFLFIRHARFEDTWWVYAGNAAFMFIIGAYTIMLTRQKDINSSAMEMFRAGVITTAIGIVLACIINLIIVIIFDPNVFGSSTPTANPLVNAPANMIRGKTNGLLFIVFVNAIFCNFMAGGFISLLTSYAVKINQKKDRAPAMRH